MLHFLVNMKIAHCILYSFIVKKIMLNLNMVFLIIIIQVKKIKNDVSDFKS